MADLKLVGVEKMLRKLDPGVLTQPAIEELVIRGAELALAYADPLLPRETGASAQTLELTRVSDGGARVSVDAFPLRFLEFGTVHIKKRRFFARTIAYGRKQLRTRLIPDAIAKIESEWGS